MSPRKLTAADKDQILELYRLPRETTSTLAERFKVSSSTISRFLKSRLNEGEYEDLIQQKRLSRTPSGAAQVMDEFKKQKTKTSKTKTKTKTRTRSQSKSKSKPEADITTSTDSELESPVKTENAAPEPMATPAVITETRPQTDPLEEETPKVAPRAATSRPRIPQAAVTSKQLSIPVPGEDEDDDYPQFSPQTSRVLSDREDPPKRRASSRPIINRLDPELEEESDDDEEDDVHALEEMLGEDIGPDDDDDWDEDEDSSDEEDTYPTPSQSPFSSDVQILPLSEANFPSICYLVIDRAAELITCPLQDFRELGTVPVVEAKQETLPVFDNHRVARRFSKRTQRVIKVPNNQVFAKTRDYLQAKGITRLLLDGQVYSL